MSTAGILTMIFAVGSIYGGLIVMLCLALFRRSTPDEEVD